MQYFFALLCTVSIYLTLFHLVQYFFVLVCFFILSFVPLCLCAILLSFVPRSPYHTALQFYSSPWHPCRLYFVHVCHFCVCGHVCARLGVWVCVCVYIWGYDFCIWGYECAGNVLISWYPKRCGQSQKADAPLVVKAACHIHHAMKSKVNKLSITLIIKGIRLIINIIIVIRIITISLTTTQWNQKWMNSLQRMAANDMNCIFWGPLCSCNQLIAYFAQSLLLHFLACGFMNCIFWGPACNCACCNQVRADFAQSYFLWRDVHFGGNLCNTVFVTFSYTWLSDLRNTSGLQAWLQILGRTLLLVLWLCVCRANDVECWYFLQIVLNA